MKLFEIIIGTEQCWTISIELTQCHGKDELYISTNVHKLIMMNQNGYGALKNVVTTTTSNSHHHATDRSIQQGRGKQRNVIITSNNGEFLI